MLIHRGFTGHACRPHEKSGLGLMALLLLLDPSGVDFALAELFYEPGQGFIGRHSFWLEDILHDRAKQAVIFVGVMAIFGFVLSLMPTRLSPLRRQLGYLVLALALSTSIVTPLKTLTGVHCPWSLSEFGGAETFTPLLSERAPTEKPGRCWPGGACLGRVLSVGSVFRTARQASSHRSHCFSCCVGTGSRVFARTYDAGRAFPLA